MLETVYIHVVDMSAMTHSWALINEVYVCISVCVGLACGQESHMSGMYLYQYTRKRTRMPLFVRQCPTAAGRRITFADDTCQRMNVTSYAKEVQGRERRG